MKRAIFSLTGVQKHFVKGAGLLKPPSTVKAVENVFLNVMPGETLAIVGESGSGKSTLARMMMGLIEPTDGTINYEKIYINDLKGKAKKQLYREVQFIFQNPDSSLNPVMTVGALIEEPLKVHGIGTPSERQTRVSELLTRVGLRPEQASRYPHEFSGGQRQRIAIARALAVSPKVIIADEPVSALDVSVQAQIINLLQSLKNEFNLTLIVISHDLAVIHHMADKIAVMYHGHIVERGKCSKIFKTPTHPYTKLLLKAMLSPVPQKQSNPFDTLDTKHTQNKELSDKGCIFYKRCRHAKPNCAISQPALVPVSDFQFSACFYAAEIAEGQPSVTPTRLSQNAAKRFEIFNNYSRAKQSN